MKTFNLQRLGWRALTDGTESLLQWDDAWYTRTQVRADAAAFSEQLAAAGVATGDVVMLVLPNGPAFIMAYLAVLELGAVAAPVYPHASQQELLSLAERLRPDWIVAPALDSGHATDFAWSCLFRGDGFMFEPQVLPQAVRWAQCRLTPDGAVRRGRLSAQRAAVLMLTSGTTGAPKGVLLSHQQLITAATHVVRSHRLGGDDVAYGILPLFHINAQVIVMLATLLSGGRLVLRDKFHASRFAADVVDHGVTWVSAVPAILGILSRIAPADVPAHTLRFVRSASAPLPPAVGARFEEVWGVPVIESYGMTEAAGPICVNALPPAPRKPGSVGRPFGVQLRVIRADGREAAVGETGEILIRGASVIRHYVDPATGIPMLSAPGGWLATGDLGYVDDDGDVFLTGRLKELINRGGEKFSPREVEDVLHRHPGVARAAVIGVPDEVYGERVVAYVIPAHKDTADLKASLAQFCEREFAKFKRPSEIYIVDALPLGPTGKVQKYRLRQLNLEQGRASAQR